MKTGRPKKTTSEMMIDAFCDLDLANQEGALVVLQTLHRQAKRAASKRFSEPAKESEADVCHVCRGRNGKHASMCAEAEGPLQ
jgi:hypothetical protein